MGVIFMPKHLILQIKQCALIHILNSLISDPNDGGMKDAEDENGKIIISDSTLSLLLPPQSKQMFARYKIMCGCECCISAKSIHS